MDLLGAALPNVMFIVGILALGLGLGIELKVVSLNKEINKSGRVGAFAVGVALIAASVFMYLNPSAADRNTTSTAVIGAAQVAPTEAPAAPAASVPPAPTIELVVAATTPPAPAAALTVLVPDLHGLSEKDVKRTLEQAGLRAGEKTDQCVGADQGDQETKKGRVHCQNPPAGQAVAPGTAVDYVMVK